MPKINFIFIFFVYFAQGFGGITSIASALILKEQLKLDFYQMGIIGAMSILPWSIKPIFGLLSDTLPIGKYRRKPYLHIGPLITTLSYFYIAFYAYDYYSFLIPTLIASFGLALTDTTTDGFIVENSNKENADRIQGLTQSGIRIASIIASFFSGMLIYQNIVSPHKMYLLASIPVIFTFILSYFIKEKIESNKIKNDIKNILTKPFIITFILIFILIIIDSIYPTFFIDMFNTIYIGKIIEASVLSKIFVWGLFFVWMIFYFKKLIKLKLAIPTIFLSVLFILLWRINLGTGNAMFFYLKDVLKINEQTLGFIDTSSNIGSIIGILCAIYIFHKVQLKKLFYWTVIVSAIWGFTSYGLTYPWFAETIGSNFFIKLIAQIFLFPTYLFYSGIDVFKELSLLKNVEYYLTFTSFISELLFMIAYIPLLKFAVLITPKEIEATNFSIITSIMNIGLAISSFLSGALYEYLKSPSILAGEIDIHAINILIAISIITSCMCLIVLPWLKIKD